MIKTLGIIALVKIYSVVHLFVALEDAKLAFCVLEKVSEGLWPVFKGFVKCVMVIQIPVIQQNCGRVQKTKKDIRGLLCREKLENGKKSTVRDFHTDFDMESCDRLVQRHLMVNFLEG